MQMTAGVAGQPSEDAFGQSCAGGTVGTGVGGAARQSLGGAPGQDAGNRLPAGVVGVQALGEEGPQGEQGAEDPMTEGNLFGVEGLLDHVLVEDSGGGQPRGLEQALVVSGDLALDAHAVTMSHEMASLREGR